MFSLHPLIFGIPKFWTMRLLHLCLRTSTNTLMTHYFKIPSLMNMVIFTTGLFRLWISSVTYLLYPLGSPPPMLTCMTAILLKRIGNPSDPILVGSLNKSSRIPTKSPQDLEAPFKDMITSRSISNPGTLSSTSPDEMRLLPLTPFSVTHQPSMMVVPWPNSLLEEIPWYVMLMASNLRNNS